MLAAPITDDRDRAVRWRQLVDVLARIEPGVPSAVEHDALELVRCDALTIDEAVRAAALRNIAGRPVSLPLLRILAVQPVRIAAPLFAGLTLSAADAEDILADADGEVRALVRIAAPPVVATRPGLASVRLPEHRPAGDGPSIEHMVERIAQLQQRRASMPAAPSPPPPGPTSRASGGTRRLFEWESDATGHIAWVDGAPRGALIGRPLGGDGIGLLEREAAGRLGQHHPFVDIPLAPGEMLVGSWSATGVPAFDPASGRFLGYRGLARRTDDAAARATPDGQSELDALRELVHEIKTPLNAIIGFAEIIDGQYLGPAHLRYRERAASIVGQARKLLDAVEDLDLAARLRAEGAAGSRLGARLSELFPPIAAELEQCLAVSGAILDIAFDHERHRCALSPELASRLLRRLLLALGRLVAANEVFRIAVTRRCALCLMTIARPHLLDGLTEAQLVDPTFNPAPDAVPDDEGQGVGLGFALRLVRGLANVAGGGLVIDAQRITLELPALDT
ncbi:MAG: hypothetical protein M3Q88_06545 [Pseudomonadota bacterium]|nr:hypothetical protein [Pseudomonadota bacterium]